MASTTVLDAVHIAGTAGATPDGYRLGLPQRENEEASVHAIRQEALRWTYMLRSRRRWVADRRARERNEAEARSALQQIGIDREELQQLAASDVVAVRIPWTGDETLHWESRIFPWEYVLSAATRALRLGDSVSGRSRQLTVIRELQRQSRAGGVPTLLPEPERRFDGRRPPRVLFVECVPSELVRQWSVTDERTRLAEVLPAKTAWRVLRHPTPRQLRDAVRDYAPTLIHFAGLDSHQGLRELRIYFGINARVHAERDEAWLRELDAPPAESPRPSEPKCIDDVLSDRELMVDGVLLRSEQDGLPLLVRAHELARLLALARRPAHLATFNLWNSAARIAPLVVAEGAAAAALGIQDAFEDSLADFVHATLYRMLLEHGWYLPRAFIETWSLLRTLPESVNATGITLWTAAPVLPLQESPPARLKPARADAGVRCSVKPHGELNYAVVHNAQPLFEKFVLECDQFRQRPVVDVDVEVHMGSETAVFRRRVTMDTPRVALTHDIHVPLTADVARNVHEAISSSISVRVESAGAILHRDTHRLRLLPVDQWRDNRRDGRWLPSFIQPRDPAVLAAVEQAQRYNRVLRDDPNAGFEGYQAALTDDEQSLAGVDRQVEAIWAVLLHDWRLGYINPPPGYSSALDSQRLRTPSMIQAHRCGTCIDLALLFASCLELIDIHPVIFLLEGHALPGWWRHPDFREEYAKMSDRRLGDVVDADADENSVASAQVVAWHTGKASHGEIRRWVRQRKLVPIETVRLTENCGFVDAIEAGVAALAARSDFDSMLEVVTARHEQVTPLPMLKETA